MTLSIQLLSVCRLCADAGAAVWGDPSLAGLCVVVVHFIPDNLFLCVLPVCDLCDKKDQ